MNIFSFTAHFGSEEDCRLHFKEQRDKEGVVCKRCGGTSHYWLQGKWSYECKGCRFRTSLRSGTNMESSKLPFLVWYKTMFLMSCTKKGFSTNELQKQLGLKRYEPVWAMVHKLRRAMGNRDARYTLEGMIELDEGYFSVASKEIERGKGTRGRGAEGKQNVAVMAESTPLEDIETGKRRSMCVISRPGYWIAIKVKESTAWSGTAWRMMPSYFRTKALLTLTSPIWWNCTSPRNQTPKPPRKHSNGCISQSVMQNGHCWATTIKSKGNTYSCISTSLFTN